MSCHPSLTSPVYPGCWCFFCLSNLFRMIEIQSASLGLTHFKPLDHPAPCWGYVTPVVMRSYDRASMASIKQNDVQITNNSINPDIVKGQPLNLNQTKTDSANITNENDRNSNLSPSKSADPARKKTFKIISVKKGGSGSGDLPGDNDGDSIDGLDESQTEDLSSEFYDSSKATDLDMDLPDSMMPLTPDEVTSTTTIVVKQKPDRDSQSRFKVVKIETKEPFRRGKWVCYDYLDSTPASVVTLEKNGSKMTEDSILHSALSGNLSSSSSVHYVQDVNDSSSNIYVTPFAPISPIGADGQHLFSDVFVPIPLAPPASQVLNPGLSSADATPFIAQQVFLSMAGVPSSSTSFYSVAQPGQTTIIQSLPPTNVFPYAQNGPSASLFQNGVAGQSNVLVNLPPDPIIATASVIPAVIPPMQPISVAVDVTAVNQDHGPGYVIVGGIPVPRSQSQTQISGVPVLSQVLQPVIENGQSLPAVGISNATNVTYSSAESASAFSGLEVDQMGPGMDESTGSIKTLQGDPEGDPPQGLEEAVEAIHTGLEGNDDDADERRASAFVARSVPIRPNALPSFVDSRNIGSPSIVRPNAHLGSRNLDSPLHIWPSPLPSHLDSRNLDSPSHHWPNALPSYFDNRNLDSPCNFCFTPVGGRSLCSSPVPPSFIEHFDSMAAGMFPPTSNSYFPYMDPSSHGSYSQASAFVPLHMPQPSATQPNHSSPCVTPSPKAISYDSRGIRGALPTVRIDSAPELRRSLSPHSLSSPTTPYTTPPRPQSLTPGGTVFKRATSVDDNRTVADGHDKITDFLVSTVLPIDGHTPEDGGGSTVAIDNRIEQAMDLVKRHLMYAVREEVEILKQQIGEMGERIGQLEYENTVLRAEAKPETLNKLLLPRVTQAQPTSALPAPTSAAPAPQQGQQSTNAQAPANHNTQNVTPQSQTQIHVQTPAQPVPQQQVQPTPGQQGTHAPSQGGHPPST